MRLHCKTHGLSFSAVPEKGLSAGKIAYLHSMSKTTTIDGIVSVTLPGDCELEWLPEMEVRPDHE